MMRFRNLCAALAMMAGLAPLSAAWAAQLEIANRSSGPGPQGADYGKAGAGLMAAEESWGAFIRAN
ncbi:hypothetical protein [Brevundimonas nasdae]|uniref:Uncharacterized protein n=1 Tax=Brevundimonas nasdae TaxID=172043 RepID=A0ABX8TIM6_9CAUL|nr:hypothetical protein [Brevundimonas nasdae]QYC11075.1 hypothetical protein KWG56_03430 [Brevundimonas nasdae]QYC13862.1 hypothetical protein KWG63_16985 [Brevundimonas nasdae]